MIGAPGVRALVEGIETRCDNLLEVIEHSATSVSFIIGGDPRIEEEVGRLVHAARQDLDGDGGWWSRRQANLSNR